MANHALSFGDANIMASWEGDRVSERLKFILRSLGVKFNGIIVTCLDRTPEHNAQVGGVSGSKHVPENNPSGKCEAGDFLTVDPLIGAVEVIAYCQAHLENIFVEYHNVGSGLHYHLDCRPVKGLQVEII
jgi:hypothetical protein